MSRSDSRFTAQSATPAQFAGYAAKTDASPEDEPDPLSLRPRPWWRLTFAYAFLALGVGLLPPSSILIDSMAVGCLCRLDRPRATAADLEQDPPPTPMAGTV